MTTCIFSYTNEEWLLFFDEKVAFTFDICKDTDSDAAPHYYIQRDQTIYSDMIGDTLNGPMSRKDLSKAVYDEVLRVIENHPELQSCPWEIPSECEDDALRDWFSFACDSFAVYVHGHRVLDRGERERDLPAEQRSLNYTVWRAFQDVKAVLDANGIEI